jgi:hypothetical protein
MQKPTTRKRPSKILLGITSAIKKIINMPGAMPIMTSNLKMYGSGGRPRPKDTNQRKIRKRRRQGWAI